MEGPYVADAVRGMVRLGDVRVGVWEAQDGFLAVAEKELLPALRG